MYVCFYVSAIMCSYVRAYVCDMCTYLFCMCLFYMLLYVSECVYVCMPFYVHAALMTANKPETVIPCWW